MPDSQKCNLPCRSNRIYMKKTFWGLCIIFLTACSHKMYRPGSMAYNDYVVTATAPKDTILDNLLKVYADSVNSTMNGVIGTAAITLNKAQPEGTLGNFMVDAMLEMARKKFTQPIDAAFINYGGIRLNQVAAGPITTGKIFELMPFDNLIVLLPLNSDTLQSFLDLVARRGGWPASGIVYTIKNNQATNILINGKPLAKSTTYNIAISDYIANGGDSCTMLKTARQINNGYVLRDALLQYVQLQTSLGKNINAKVEGRVKKE
jgi:2',3'-cyclic-nucleotide 2'-phosphodiesterase (5'-nucleotidase family)